MAEAFGLDRRIEAYSGKRPIGLYRWDLNCLLAVMALALSERETVMLGRVERPSVRLVGDL